MRLPVQTYDLDDPASTARLQNCYVEPLPGDARAPYLLRRCPGIANALGSFSPSAGIIAMTYSKYLNRFFGITENSEINWEANESTFTFAGNPVQVATNRNANIDFAHSPLGMVTVIEPNAWTQTQSDATTIGTQIADADFTSRGASSCEFLDNYILFVEPNSGRFFSSDVGSLTAYTSTNFATAEKSPDDLVGQKANDGQLLLFGEQSIEVWDATGGSGFPFRSVLNAAVDRGCAASKSILEVDGIVVWVADDKTVRRFDGLTPTKISHPAIDRHLQNEGSISSVRAQKYVWDGHHIYVLYLTDVTLCYDFQTGQWHERRSAGDLPWQFEAIATNGELFYLGDKRLAKVGLLSGEVFTEPEAVWEGTAPDNTLPTVMSWTYQPVYGAGQRVFHDRLEIVMNTGITKSATAPLVNLEISDDGGREWFTAAERDFGAVGETYQRVVWHNLGSSYQRVYRASIDADVPITVTGTELDVRGGNY